MPRARGPTFKAVCPACGARARIIETKPGFRRLSCPACGTKWRLDREPAAAAPDDTPREALFRALAAFDAMPEGLARTAARRSFLRLFQGLPPLRADVQCVIAFCHRCLP